MKFLPIPHVFLLVLIAGLSQTVLSAIDFEMPASYRVHRMDTQIILDGIDEEPIWASAEVIDGFVDITGARLATSPLNTRVRMLWDEDYLYILAEMEEPHVWANITQRDAPIYNNNAFEIFINPDDSQQGYVEYEVNALGTLWDLRLDLPYGDGGRADSSWTSSGLEWAVNVSGTLNDPNDVDCCWSVEWKIPAREISRLHGAEWPTAKPWRMNFLQVRWVHEIIDGRYERQSDTDRNPLPASYLVWTPQHAVDMHQPEHWGYVTFIGPP